MKPKTLDDRARASDPGKLKLSHAKMRKFHPQIYGFRASLIDFFRKPARNSSYWRTYFEEHMQHGDSRAALVVSLRPLLIAAYTDEFDCVAMLQFPAELVSEYRLRAGQRLLTVNTYTFGERLVFDLEHGPASYRRFRNFSPLIAEFLSDDTQRIETRKSLIAEAEWKRTEELAQQYLSKHGCRARNGLPLYCNQPANIKSSRKG
jgi:hypothetical protein